MNDSDPNAVICIVQSDRLASEYCNGCLAAINLREQENFFRKHVTTGVLFPPANSSFSILTADDVQMERKGN